MSATFESINQEIAETCADMLGLTYLEQRHLLEMLSADGNKDCFDDCHRRGYCFIPKVGEFSGWVDKLSQNRPNKPLRFECSFWSADQWEQHRFVISL